MSAVEKIPRNGKLMANLITAYQNLHILAYYRGGVGVQMIKEKTVTQKSRCRT
ncbi:hypothetical protein LM594_03720 [Candidatus Caldipriscus sp.]|nr:hypothetical protein [Candidatus Caldipriscus sp.]